MVRKEFTLAAKHFSEGIQANDFLSYVGFHIPVFRLSDFPHSEKISSGIKLSEKQFAERSYAIWQAAIKNYNDAGFLQPYALSKNNFDWLAAQEFSCFSSSFLYRLQRPNWTLTRGHYDEIYQQGLLRLQTCDLYEDKNIKRAVVYPEPIENKHFSSAQAPKLATHAFPVVLLETLGDDAYKSWAKLVGVSPRDIQRVPKENWIPIEAALHEMRHLIQLFPVQKISSMYRFYCELDAELFARDVMRRSSVKKDFLSARLHARYMDILFAPDEYWVAPALEAIEKGLSPPRYTEIAIAVKTFRNALMNCSGNAAPQNIISDSPLNGATLMRDAQKDHAVQENYMAGWIAKRIQRALYYFCPQA